MKKQAQPFAAPVFLGTSLSGRSHFLCGRRFSSSAIHSNICFTTGPSCKLTRAFGPRNSMKIAQSQAIIQNGWEWRDRKDNGDAEAECKFDPERA